jgi:hypothetical protein
MQTQNQKIKDNYNLLPDVEWADDKLSSLDKTGVLESLSGVIVKHRLEDLVGIRLLHAHNRIRESEMMIEEEEMDGMGRNCLVTMAKQEPATIAGYSTNSWQLCDNEFIPLEFSTDEMVVAEPNLLSQNTDFFSEFAAALKKLSVEDILGPCIVKRSFYKNYRPGGPSILVETTDVSRRANVLKFDDKDNYDLEALIQTTWLAIKSPNSENPESDCSHCTPLCEPAACVPISACVKDASGTHTQENFHDKGNHTSLHG